MVVLSLLEKYMFNLGFLPDFDPKEGGKPKP
jgi:hypothetical protein